MPETKIKSIERKAIDNTYYYLISDIKSDYCDNSLINNDVTNYMIDPPILDTPGKYYYDYETENVKYESICDFDLSKNVKCNIYNYTLDDDYYVHLENLHKFYVDVSKLHKRVYDLLVDKSGSSEKPKITFHEDFLHYSITIEPKKLKMFWGNYLSYSLSSIYRNWKLSKETKAENTSNTSKTSNIITI